MKHLNTAFEQIKTASKLTNKSDTKLLLDLSLYNILEFLKSASFIKIVFNIKKIVNMIKEVIEIIKKLSLNS